MILLVIHLFCQQCSTRPMERTAPVLASSVFLLDPQIFLSPPTPTTMSALKIRICNHLPWKYCLPMSSKSFVISSSSTHLQNSISSLGRRWDFRGTCNFELSDDRCLSQRGWRTRIHSSADRFRTPLLMPARCVSLILLLIVRSYLVRRHEVLVSFHNSLGG